MIQMTKQELIELITEKQENAKAMTMTMRKEHRKKRCNPRTT